MSRKNGRPTFRLSFNYSGGGFDPSCREMSELMIEQPDGTLCPCTSANAPSDALSSDLDDRTRAALDSSVMDGLFSAFDAQDPLSQLTQVADAGNVMSDSIEDNSPDTSDSYSDIPNEIVLPVDAPPPYSTIGEDYAENLFWPGYHQYRHMSDRVCRVGIEGCALSDVIGALNKVATHPDQTRPFTPGQSYTADVDMIGPWGADTIKTIPIYSNNREQIGIRNIALADHVLYPGIVERYVVNIHGWYRIFTLGHGTGKYGTFNSAADWWVWGQIDSKIISHFEDKRDEFRTDP